MSHIKAFPSSIQKFVLSTALVSAAIFPTIAKANPWGNFADEHGSISIDTSIADHTRIGQHTNLYIGRSGNLDIEAAQSVTIDQMSTSSMFVAKSVNGVDPTRILGALRTTLNGNGTGGALMILDPNGVFFGKDSVIDTGAIIASTGQLNNQALINNNRVELSNFGDGAIEMNGTITMAEGGLAAFVAPSVINNGIITAKAGRIELGGSNTITTVDLYGDGLMEIALDSENSEKLAAVNNGMIDAEGGVIHMTTGAAKNIVDSVVNMNGVAKASSVTQKGGKIILGGAKTGTVKVAGKAEANGGSEGGNILAKATNVSIESTASLSADATHNGNGGEIKILGDAFAVLQGQVSAKGGGEGGNGGFVELSSNEDFILGGAVDTSAANGQTGTLLIDPRDITIRVGTRNIFSDFNYLNRVYESDIEVLSLLTNIDILARRDITVAANTYGASDGVITVNGGNNLTIRTTNSPWLWEGDNAGVIDLTGNTQYGADLEFRTTGNGSINILGATDGDQASDIMLSKLTTENGNINIETKNGSITWLGDVTTQSGAINGTSTGQNKVSNTVTTNTGDVYLIGGGVNFWDTGLMLANDGVVKSTSGNIDLQANNTKLVINGKSFAGNGNLNLVANANGRIEFWGAGELQGDSVNMESGLGITQGMTGKITANILTASANQDISLFGTNNDIGSLSNISAGLSPFVGGAIKIHDKNGFNVTGKVESEGDITFTTNSTNFAESINVLSAGSLISNGGNIDIDTNGASGGFITLSGNIDTDTGNVTLNGRQNRLQNGSTITANTLTTNGASVNQQAGSAITAALLQGSLAADAAFNGTNNQITVIGDFATGTANWNKGGFTLVNNSGQRLDVNGTISSDNTGASGNGLINISTTGDLTIKSTGGVTTQDAAITMASGTLVDVDMSANIASGNGDITLNAPNVNLGADLNTTGAVSGTATLVNVENDTAQIQDGIDVAVSGATVNVAAGTFSENLTLDKALTINGNGTSNTTILDGTAIGGNGIDVAANDVSMNGMIVENFNYGLNVTGGIANLELNDIYARYNNVGFKVANAGSIDGLNITDSRFNNNTFGWYFAKDDNNIANTSTVTNVTVTNTDFDGNTAKGIYAEKLDNATFTNVNVMNSGVAATTSFSNAGIDINLKNGKYRNILFDNLTVSGSGLNSNSGASIGNAVTIKARNDSTTYSATPAVLRNLTIRNSNIDAGGDIAIAFGNDIRNARIFDSEISGTEAVVLYGGVRNANIRRNTITNTGTSARGQSYGIGVVGNTGTTTINRNTISGVGEGNGIVTASTDKVTLNRNDVNNFKNGINIIGGNNIAITNNSLTNNTDTNAGRNSSGWTTGAGIIVQGGASNVNVSTNTVTDNTDGIRIDAAGTSVVVENNTVSNSADKGIIVKNTNDVDVIGNVLINNKEGIRNNIAQRTLIENNTITSNGNQTGMLVDGNSDNVEIFINDVTGGGTAIKVEGGSDNVAINENTVANAKTGVHVLGATGSDITLNTINNANQMGVLVENASDVLVSENEVNDAGVYGIAVNNISEANIVENILTGNATGIKTDGDNTDMYVLSGNQLTNNNLGMLFKGGVIDLTDLANPNLITVGETGMRFLPDAGNSDNLSLLSNTLGSTVFTGQIGNYIELGNGALFNPGTPTIIDALAVEFDGVMALRDGILPGILTATQRLAIEDKIIDFDDNPTLGQILVGLTFDIADEDLFALDLFSLQNQNPNVNVVFTGLPPVTLDVAALNALTPAAGGSAADFAAIQPAAGGDDMSVDELANIETAAGVNEGCWATAGSQNFATYVSFSFGGDITSNLSDPACAQ